MVLYNFARSGPGNSIVTFHLIGSLKSANVGYLIYPMILIWT